MTDYQLKEFARKAQEDARRCYQIYLQHRKWMDEHGGIGGFNDAVVWQSRYHAASAHAIGMLKILTLRGNNG